MSGLIVGLVLRLQITEEFNSEAKFIATVYADHAWEDGTHAYPSVDTVAKITGFSERTVQRYLRTLEKSLLVLDGKGPRGTNRYKFTLRETTDGSVGLVLRGGVTQSPPASVENSADSGVTQSPRQADGVTRNRVTGPSGDTSDTRIRDTQTNNPLIVVVKAYESEIGALTPLIADALKDACETYPPDWIPEAIKIAAESNVRTWKYVEGILKNCKSNGIRPALNKLEVKHVKNNRSGSKPAAAAQRQPQQYSAADLAAAERIKQRQQV